MSLAAGDKLGPYEILSPLGAGGMGEVWRARDARLERTVAIKRLKAENPARFQQEARAIAALNHPHICQIYDVGADYLVMEFIDGRPLRGPFLFEDAIRLALQIADALEYAHSCGIFHRDLKPANILLSGKRAKLLDFGLAKSVAAGAETAARGPETAASGDATQTIEGTVMGTPAYMPPEQVQGKLADARSDIFSFGAVLYEMLTGRRAFDGLSSVLHSDAPKFDSPAALIVRQCLAKQPSERFQNMSELKAALEHLLSRPSESQPTIAVLPFVNVSGDQDQEYFSEGLAEEILNALAHMPGLKVTARTSSFAFRGRNEPIPRIAEILRVRTILEGSVRRSGARIRVTAQLINAEDGYHLWSERYDREMTDVFAVQDEIAAAIARALEVELTGKAAVPLYKPSLPAYEALLKGRYHITKFTPGGFARAREYFEQAISLDPRYAEPHAELGRYYFYLGMWSIRPPSEVMPLARAEARIGLDLNPADASAHAVLCFVASVYEYDWPEARRQYRLTMEANPVPPLARARVAFSYLLPLGCFDEAVRQIEIALEQDPLNITLFSTLASVLLFARRYEQTIAVARRAIDIDENHWQLHLNVCLSFAFRQRYEEAREPAETAYRLAPWNATVIGSLAGILDCLGERDRAAELLSKMPENGSSGRVAYHLLCSEVDACAEWYEKDIALRQPMAALRASSGFLEPLRNSPRWHALARMMNFPHADPDVTASMP
jgi:serine/threonine-protein kinase